MLKQTWQVESPHGVCAATRRTLAEGEEFYTVLFEDGESFRRADFSLEAWTGPPEGSFCHFKTRVPVRQKKKQLLVDDELLMAFFTRLADEAETARVHFRFVLALILMRKKKLRYDGSQVSNGVETWTMTVPREGKVHRVVNPRLNDAEIESVSGQLSAILHGDMGEWAGEAAAIQAETSEEQE